MSKNEIFKRGNFVINPVFSNYIIFFCKTIRLLERYACKRKKKNGISGKLILYFTYYILKTINLIIRREKYKYSA